MNVDIVIVTYNRLEKLKKALQCYENQTQPFRNLIVVNNHCTDGTAEYLEEWKSKTTPFGKYVITNSENLGGSGGFYVGQKFAMSLNPDWIYVADDDAYASANMMEQFYGFFEKEKIKKIAAICACVKSVDGYINNGHRGWINIDNCRFFKKLESKEEDYLKSFFSIDILSYVGSFLNTSALKEVGLVNPQYFIYYDDTEHSLRLRKFGIILCVPSIIVVHDELLRDVKENLSNMVEDSKICWKNYYFYRNMTRMCIKHYPIVALHELRITIMNKIKYPKARSNEEWMRRIAIRDAWLHKLGRHKIYIPGWSK